MLAFPVDFAEELDAMLMYDNTSRDQMKEIVRLDRGGIGKDLDVVWVETTFNMTSHQ